MFRRDVGGSEESKIHLWGQELRLVPNLIWGPVVFTEYSEIWSSSIHNIMHRLLSPKLQEWICCLWHQPDVEASSALAKASQCRWIFILDMQWLCTVMYTLIWDTNSFCCKSNWKPVCVNFKTPVLANNSQGFCRACWGHHYTPQQTLTLFHNQVLWPDISPRILLLSFKWKSSFLCSAFCYVSLLHPSSERPMVLWDQLFLSPSDGSLGEKDEDSVHAATHKAHKILIGIAKWRYSASGKGWLKKILQKDRSRIFFFVVFKIHLKDLQRCSCSNALNIHKVLRASLALAEEGAEVAHRVAFAVVEHSTGNITPVVQ